MIKKKDYELIEEAYQAVLAKRKQIALKECWDQLTPEQKSSLQDKNLADSNGNPKNGYKMHKEGDNVVLTHHLKGSEGAERDIILDEQGEEVKSTVHIGDHKVQESSEIEKKATLDPKNLVSKANDLKAKHLNVIRRQDPGSDISYAAGAVAACERVQGIKTSNPHAKDSKAAERWNVGFKDICKELGYSDSEDNAHSSYTEAKCSYASKGCRCSNCEACEKKDGEKVCKKCMYLEGKCKCAKTATEESLIMADLYNQIIEEAKKKMSKKDEKEMGKIISKEMKKGHKQKQAVAIAYEETGKGKKKK